MQQPNMRAAAAVGTEAAAFFEESLMTTRTWLSQVTPRLPAVVASRLPHCAANHTRWPAACGAGPAASCCHEAEALEERSLHLVSPPAKLCLTSPLRTASTLQVQHGMMRDGEDTAAVAMQGRDGPAEPVVEMLATYCSAQVGSGWLCIAADIRGQTAPPRPPAAAPYMHPALSPLPPPQRAVCAANRAAASRVPVHGGRGAPAAEQSAFDSSYFASNGAAMRRSASGSAAPCNAHARGVAGCARFVPASIPPAVVDELVSPMAGLQTDPRCPPARFRRGVVLADSGCDGPHDDAASRHSI